MCIFLNQGPNCFANPSSDFDVRKNNSHVLIYGKSALEYPVVSISGFSILRGRRKTA